MSITFSIDAPQFRLNDRNDVRQWISSVVNCNHKRVGTISYKFCDDESVLKINQQFLNHDTYTDIITFDYVQGDLISGDIVISVERVADNAKKLGVPFAQELRRVIIHGVLHLLGNGDKTDSEAKVMRGKEDEALQIWKEMRSSKR